MGKYSKKFRIFVVQIKYLQNRDAPFDASFFVGSIVLLMFRILYNFAAPFIAGGYLRLITNQDDI